MSKEKKILLDKIDYLINKRKSDLLHELPDVHEVDDGIIIRFFGEWDNCDDNNDIKFKRIINHGNLDESVVFFYIPKGACFELKQQFYIGHITCLNGLIRLTSNSENQVLRSYEKILLNADDVKGEAFENTYLITTSDRATWSKKTMEHTEKYREELPHS